MKSIVVGGFTRGIVAASALSFSVGVFAAGITIDDFADPFTESVDANGAVMAVGVNSQACGQATENSGTILGGERDVSIEVLEGANAVVARVINGHLSISNESQTRGDVIVQWDGSDNDASLNSVCSLQYSLNANLVESGGNQFELMVIENDAPVTILIRAYTSSTKWSQYSLDVNAGNANQTFTIGLSSSHWELHGGGVAWSNVGAIEMEVVGVRNLDITFDYLVTPVTYNDGFDRVKDVKDGVVLCWETTMEDNVEGFFFGQCNTSMSDCNIEYVDAKGNADGAPYCHTIPGSMKPNNVYGVVNVDRDFTAGDIHWME